jgi:ubiquinone/menaquinone biosynthesis C-methylase UbiE
MANEPSTSAERESAGGDARARAYYDEFSKRYDDQRGGRVAGGYHDLVDDLELDFLERHAAGKSILEVGCGTGLLLARMAAFASHACGVDLSEGMLEHARSRGLDVTHASATELPFDEARFDVACSFKVLAHVPEVRKALAEMARVVRPGGVVVAEFYNPWSLRGLVKRLGPSRAISDRTTEAAVYTRYDAPWQIPTLLPRTLQVIDTRGVRVLVPAAALLRAPWLGRVLRAAEWRLCDSPLRYGAGFWLVAARKQ